MLFPLVSLRKKALQFLVAIIFLFGVIGFFGASVAHASLFDFIRAFVTINPLSVEVTVPAEVDVNRVFKVEAIVINKGEVKIENVTGKIHLSTGLSLVVENETKNIRIIPAEREKKILWQVSGGEAGNYVITVSISGVVNGDVVTAEGTKLVTIVKKAPPPGKPVNIFENFFNFLEKWFGRQG